MLYMIRMQDFKIIRSFCEAYTAIFIEKVMIPLLLAILGVWTMYGKANYALESLTKYSRKPHVLMQSQ